ncbi:hypothetical protein GCM10010172_46920 [Paractinoplanes ferrugineus]|uniref:DUF4132 domain-containing protein n=1 Tax=Paractinoplanes ferrugineus TaxID=113564 RepID=A0A919M8A6_9ACTN|nr:DUF4132 domain-containing protein [Actinoplanes ferrugineus]GIE10276.1 hypothetical protein Afe05nite_21160 [Actinoplanes ferrugineus]
MDTDQLKAAAQALADRIIAGEPGRVLAGEPPLVRRLALLYVHRFIYTEDSSLFGYFGAALTVAEDLETPWAPDDLRWSLDLLLKDQPERTLTDALFWVPALIATQLDRPCPAGQEDRLRAAFDALNRNPMISPSRLQRLARLYGAALGRLDGGVPGDLMMALTQARTDGAALLPMLAEPEVQEICRYAADLAKVVPTRTWLRAADERLAASPRAKEAVTRLLTLYRGGAYPVPDHVDALLRGLVWLQSRDPAAESTALLSDVATVVGSPARRGGAMVVAAKAAAAVVEVLATRPGDAPVRALVRLSLTVRSKSLLPRVRGAVERIGRERGWQPGEAAELAVDDHGLDPAGRRIWPLSNLPPGSLPAGSPPPGNLPPGGLPPGGLPPGDLPAGSLPPGRLPPGGDDGRGGAEGVVEVVGGKARLRAVRAGVPLKVVPTAWKGALAEARAQVTGINKTLAVERLRIEGLFSQERIWQWDIWQRRYLEHPLTGATARQLIWQASPDGSRWCSGRPEPAGDGWTLSGLPEKPGAGWQVRLWHPALAGTAEVARWRDRLAAAEHSQPVKQAFREVYPLTPAEEETRVYSNRFAGHILHYRQTNALMRERGWAADYLGQWDGGYHGEAKKEFGGGEWQAVFFHDWVESSTWAQPFCATDQVRFGRRDGRAWAITPLAEVPPLVFSEAMRDVDLFVGVTSIAADDNWRDRGEHRDYWRSAAFGALTPRGETRRDALARLLPRLALGRCSELRERFLRVEGKLGAYRIHLGSANILMEPDDAYLCIVPDRGRAGKLSLPFDDDPVLSVILAKAILLAADDKITDETITRQLHRNRL